MMRLSRRSVLAGMAAAPVAAALPASAAIDPAFPIPTSGPPVVAPEIPKAWRWWYGDGELFHPADSKADAIAAAQDEGSSTVVEAYQDHFDLRIGGYRILEWICDQNEERCGPDGECIHDRIEAAQEKDLEDMVHAAIQQWVAKHKIDTLAWAFAEQRNQIDVELHSDGSEDDEPV